MAMTAEEKAKKAAKEEEERPDRVAVAKWLASFKTIR